MSGTITTRPPAQLPHRSWRITVAAALAVAAVVALAMLVLALRDDTSGTDAPPAPADVASSYDCDAGRVATAC